MIVQQSQSHISPVPVPVSQKGTKGVLKNFKKELNCKLGINRNILNFDFKNQNVKDMPKIRFSKICAQNICAKDSQKNSTNTYY